MAGETLGEVIRRLGRFAGMQGDLAQTDAQLLDRFARGRDEAAFAALMARHGPMVLGLCRRLLSDPRDAEDAFQATFLILARKAAAVQRQTLLGSWLYGVAWRVALPLRGQTSRRRERELSGVDLTGLPADDAAWSDARWVVHEEVQRLPDVYRSAVILCCLEGKTNEEAAVLLRRPVGTVKSRLTRARELLRTRLTRRGMAPSAGALAAALSAHPAPAALLDATVRAAARVAAGDATAGGLASARAVALTQGVLRAMMLTKLKIAAALVLAVAMLGGIGGLGYRSWATAPGDALKPSAPMAAAHEHPQEKNAAGKAADEPADDKDAIQGTWEVVGIEKGGRQLLDTPLNKEFFSGKWVFAGDRLVVAPSAKELPEAVLTYTLDPSKTPKQMDKKRVSQGGAPAGQKEVIPSIYSLEGDTLKICTGAGKDRPTELAAPRVNQNELVTLRRVSAAAPAGGKSADSGERPTDAGNHGAKLLQEWRDASSEALRLHREEFDRGKITPEVVIAAEQRLLEAELAGAVTKAERVAAYEAHLRRVKEVMKVVNLRSDAGKIASADVADVEAYLIKAEVLLEQEKAK